MRVAEGSRVTRWRSRDQEASNIQPIANKILSDARPTMCSEIRWLASNNDAVEIPARTDLTVAAGETYRAPESHVLRTTGGTPFSVSSAG